MATALAALSYSSTTRKRKQPLTIDRDQYTAANPRIDGDDAYSRVDLDLLNAELRCPICLRLMRDPMATECLHRFCKDCIEKTIRSQSQKQCPSCRKPIATRRSLRPDPNITQLIKRLYPDLEGFEKEEEEAMVEGNREVAERHHAHVSQHYAKIHERQQL